MRFRSNHNNDYDNNKELEESFFHIDDDLEVSSKKWLSAVKSIVKASFKKVRIRDQRLPSQLQSLFRKREALKLRVKNTDNLAEIMEELNVVESDISDISAEKNRNIVEQYLGSNDTIEGYSHPKTWSLIKKLAPKHTTEPSTAKKDRYGNLITNKEG